MTITPRQIWQILRRGILKSIAGIAGQEFRISSGNVLIVAPHPDDEVLGCGGLIAELTAKGKKVNVLFLTNGSASHKDCCTASEDEIGSQRRHLALKANGILGIPKENLTFLDGVDGKLPRKGQSGFKEMAHKLGGIIKDKAPNTIFCPHPLEGWSDHVAASELTIAAMEQVAPEKNPQLYYYCVWFWYSLPLKKALGIDWKNARVLDIKDQFSIKQKAISLYTSSFAPCGQPWAGKLPKEFLRAFDWQKELFFVANIQSLSKSN